MRLLEDSLNIAVGTLHQEKEKDGGESTGRLLMSLCLEVAPRLVRALRAIDD